MPRFVLQLSMLMTLGFVFGVLPVSAAEVEDGLKQGDAIGAFYVTKAGGAVDDGVEEGEELCYRCRYGSRPMVIVFARDTSGKVSELIKEIDTAVTANEESQLKGLLTLLGKDADALMAQATQLADKASVKQVAVVVAKETQTGPTNYKISADAAVTVVIANDSQVVATHTFDADKIDIAAVMNEVKQMLN